MICREAFHELCRAIQSRELFAQRKRFHILESTIIHEALRPKTRGRTDVIYHHFFVDVISKQTNNISSPL